MASTHPHPTNAHKRRMRDLGYSPGHFPPGRQNSIVDVPGVTVGQVTLHDNEKNIHTGVTVILPRGTETLSTPCYAGTHSLNGCGEVTGIHVIKEWGYTNSPIALTNTLSVGKVYDALFRWEIRKLKELYGDDNDLAMVRRFGIPVVGETYDGLLNDIEMSAVEREDVEECVRRAEAGEGGSVLEGSYGGGCGMMSHGFKAGTGTASRVLPGFDGKGEKKEYTLGVLVQANHGQKPDLRVGNVMVGKLLMKEDVSAKSKQSASDKEGNSLPVGGKAAEGSIIVVLITDAPLLPHQLNRLAQRASVGISQVGSHAAGRNYSGEIFIALSTGTNPNKLAVKSSGMEYLPPLEAQGVESVLNETIDSLFYATSEVVEEAILNSLCKAETLSGFKGRTVEEMPLDRVRELLGKYMVDLSDTSDV